VEEVLQWWVEATCYSVRLEKIAFLYDSTVQVGPGHISGEVSTAHSDTPHSVGWVIGPSQTPVTWQYTSHKRHSCPLWDSNTQFQHPSGHRTTP